ncbi:MAG: EamA family transporter [Synergistaceae bacterium]|jgi:transporter family protein|nr:EamA family transporter [Synergistaceae bacterium]
MSAYIVLALLSAVFSAMTAVLGKKGLSGIDSNIAVFLRTCVVLVYVWAFVFVSGEHECISHIDARSLLFLLMSGCAAGASWMCYYKALSLGLVRHVTALDKSSVLMTMIIGMTFLGESVTPFKLSGMLLIALGAYLMLAESPVGGGVLEGISPRGMGAEGARAKRLCLLYAAVSAFFAALTSIFAKVGLEGVDASLAAAVRTAVMLVFAGIMLRVTGSCGRFGTVRGRDVFYICLSALMTALAWLCYFNALRMGEASIVAPLDKLSAIMTVLLARLVLKEPITLRAFAGIGILTSGTVLVLF